MPIPLPTPTQHPEHAEVQVGAELQHKLELLQRALNLPSATAVLERLMRVQIERSVLAVTGIRCGPRLAINNATTAQHRTGT